MMEPVRGALVAPAADKNNSTLGVVRSVGEQGANKVKVYWVKDGDVRWHNLSEIRSALRVGHQVLHKPAYRAQRSLGWGVVRSTREIAGNDQVLVEFPEKDKRVWLPWQRLMMIRGVKHAFFTGKLGDGDAAERQRLRILAWAIRLWNENTGALASFDIDPLPHQIHLVHHILASGQYNWLIADDVGLGKTIEVGLLLSALRQRGEARRLLLVTPAGLTRQWQEEMAGKFGLNEFLVYGDDFTVNDPRHWKMFDNVVGSMDRLKQDEHLDSLMQAEPWDLIIVDEAHRFTRRQYGNKLDASQRYEMLQKLRRRTESMLLLTATPHQGKEDSFTALLELLQPERREELNTLSINPEIIGEMVIRNYKADVTDMDGNFIFSGKTVTQINVPSSEAFQNFDNMLRDYLKKGYAAESALNSNKGRAIGFVMAVYRKLASSSVAAIHNALVKRRERLKGRLKEEDGDDEDGRYQGEVEERAVYKTEATPFFEGEEALLEDLIDEAHYLKGVDSKIDAFMKSIVDVIVASNIKEKVLVFAEYRSTQSWIEQALKSRFGESSAVLIHGGMSMDERRSAIDSFEDASGAQFLVSTEAGGEGINLQHQCHIMVNYDLPWNPMRLVQRMGRLYRYGQEKRVIVFNMHQSASADDQIINILYQRLDKVAEDMSNVEKHEYNEALKDDVLGELADLIDIEEVLISASNETIARTAERVDEALERAKNASSKQHELFQHAASFDGKELDGVVSISAAHLQAFVEGMCRILGIEILEKTHKGLVWQLRFSDEVKEATGVSRSRWGLVFDRMLAVRRKDLLPITTDNWFFQYLLSTAADYEFGGVAAVSGQLGSDWLLTAVARWQTDRGRRARQELALIGVENGKAILNPKWVPSWLCQPLYDDQLNLPDKAQAKQAFELAQDKVESFLVEKSSKALLPDEAQWLAGAGRAV
jgi:ERCC4-related helicase